MRNSKKIRLLSILLVVMTVLSTLSFGQAAFAAENPNSGNDTIKNIIVMIPDGSGFGSYDMAEAVKLADTAPQGETTPITTDAISGLTAEGLYLSHYMVGSAITKSADSSVTDSAAGGTAIATGHKTYNGAISITPDKKTPIASLLEASQIAGKSTGLVATKFWFDATPAAFASHATNRGNYDQITSQMLNHNLDVLLGGGNGNSTDGKISPADLGYTVVKNRTELAQAVANGDSRVWSSFNSGSTSTLVMDYQNSTRPEHPTLLEMTKAAIEILSKNTNNENGFFLMVEGSQVDSGGHGSNALQAVSEYLAFDEAFAYAVNWAMEDGHTIVYGLPDHDTGGFTPNNEAEAINSISNGQNPAGSWAGNGGHTGQNVGIWLYAPESVRADLLTEIGLPTEGGAENTRTGKYYNGVKFNSSYAVQNSAVAPVVAKFAGLDLDAATKELFVDITSTGTYSNGTFTVKKTGIQIPENANYYFLEDGTKVDFKYGVSVYIGGRFYVPQHVADTDGTVPVDTWTSPFADVTENDDFFEAVAFVYANNLFFGTDKGFEPLTPMTRAMYVTVLSRLAKADTSPYKNYSAKDVPSGQWYSEPVGWATTNKVVLGNEFGEFMPDVEITREQMMLIIYNYANSLGKSTTMTTRLNYTDVGEIHDWAYDAVMYCTAYGLVSADENGEIRPTELATRADVAELMMNFANKIVK